MRQTCTLGELSRRAAGCARYARYSPELLPPKDGEISQKTEDLVGPYELHDFFLYYMLRFGYPPRKILPRCASKTFAGVYDDATIKKWLSTFCRRFFHAAVQALLPAGRPEGRHRNAFAARRLAYAVGRSVPRCGSRKRRVCNRIYDIGRVLPPYDIPIQRRISF